MKILRTPLENFENLKDYYYDGKYLDIPIINDSTDVNNTARMHYVDENKNSTDIVLLLHGEPTWSY